MRKCEICRRTKKDHGFKKEGRIWSKICIECVQFRRVSQYRDGKFHVVVEENVEFVADLVIVGTRKHEIMRLIRLWIGPGPNGELITLSTAEKLLTLARESLVKATALSRKEHRAIALDFYKSIIRNPEAHIRDKLNAQKRVDKLLGLEVHEIAPPWRPQGAEYLDLMRNTVPGSQNDEADDGSDDNGNNMENFFSH